MAETYLSKLARRAADLRGQALLRPLARVLSPRPAAAPQPLRLEGEYLRRILGAGMCFVDVGASQGELTWVAAAQLPEGQVLAFEPDAGRRQALHAEAQARGLARVRVFDDAAAPRLCQLDRLVEDHGIERIDVLRIDIPGLQLAVLEGARRTLQRLRPTLIVALGEAPHRPASDAASGVLDALADLRYRTHAFQPRHAHGTGELAREGVVSRARSAPLNVLCRPA